MAPIAPRVAFAIRPRYLLRVRPFKLPLPIALGLPLLVFLLLAWKLNFLTDDAFISFRYTQNWVAGHGLRYNLGSEMPVEGYSNFLWVLMMAPFEAWGMSLGGASRLLSGLSGLILCFCVTRHARRRFDLDNVGTLACGLFFASLPCTALWATGGLATMPAALLTFCMYERLLGDPEAPRGRAAGIFGALAVLMRADGFLWAAMILFGAGLAWFWSRRDQRLLREALWCTGIIVLVSAGHFLWRHSYYGEWLPNTARVKAGFSTFRLERGWAYLAQWWLTMPALFVVLVLSIWRIPNALRAPLVVSLTVALGAQAYALWIGGDFMPFGRLMFAAVPFIALLFAALWSRLSQDKSGTSPAALGLGALLILSNLLGCFGVSLVPDSVRSRFHFRLSNTWQSEMDMRSSMIERTQSWELLGRALALFTQPQDSIVLSGIGAIGYHSRLQIHDLYGLVSPEVLKDTQPLKKASPGHDRAVLSSFFLDQHPTLGGAFIAPANAPPNHGMPPGWEQTPFSKLLRLERHPLPVEQNFPPGLELRMLVYKAWPKVGRERVKSQ
ncbi:MAG: arabinofuranosyltransferase [Candidatus Paceibacteria bacterium]|jgi:arabinofuranosyltransferase